MSTLIYFVKFSVIQNVKILARNIVISELKTIFRKQFIRIIITYLHPKFHIAIYEQ
jgi:uncharacterized iron-regulated protein